MDYLPLADAAFTANVSVTTLRNYIRDGKLNAFKRAGRTVLDRAELMSVFGVKPVTARSPSEGCRIIAVANQKGGVGKTTTAVALATVLAETDPVLALDSDPQGNMTQAFGFDPDAQEHTLYNALVEELPLEQTLLRVGPPPADLYLVPANLDLAETTRRVLGRVGVDSLLRTALDPLLSRFRYVVIDCPPSLDPLTINALVAATEIIIPIDMSLYSVRGMAKLRGTIQEVRKVNPTLGEPRVVLCRTERTVVSKAIEEKVRKSFSEQVFSTSIPRGKDIAEAQYAKIPLTIHAPKGKPTEAYVQLAQEVRHGR